MCSCIVWYQVWRLIIRLHNISLGHWTCSCAISTARRIYNPAACSAHISPIRYSFTPESSEACRGKVPCPRTQTSKHVPKDANIEAMSQRWELRNIISLKICPKRTWNQHDSQRQLLQSAIHALTIAPLPFPCRIYVIDVDSTLTQRRLLSGIK